MIHCRRATIEDHRYLVDGNHSIAKETEGIELSETKLGPGIKAILEDENKGIYWVAIHEGQIIGQILVTYEWSDWRNGQIWWIQSVYVWPDARQQGVFKALLDRVTTEARDNSVVELRLYADTTNQKAHSTYFSQGFTTGHYQVFEKPL
ncbi:MAG: Aminoalkylphosphonate N-acetyltransferase [Gammaproteobacteria bacterium]|nr:MAG: Aminoalkylphosphonate N-acetyltransferase [Gammaproteobacteria bacterium]